MSADSVVYDMSSMSEGSPSVFVRRDNLTILDNQNQNYNGNQSVLDTSQLANSNKYMNYREAYFTIPMVLTLTSALASSDNFQPATAATSADYCLGLKNWYGSIVHSLTVDLQGTTIVQQTPYIGLWNTFKLMTSLSVNDVKSQGSQIGFHPDNALSVSYQSAASPAGINSVVGTAATTNNVNLGAFPVVSGAFNSYDNFNSGLLRRQQAWNFDLEAVTSPAASSVAFSTLISSTSCNNLWKSYIYNKVNGASAANVGVWQCAITAQVYLKHLHSFFERVPLLKGVFMKITMNLNQTSCTFTSAGAGGNLAVTSVNSPLGGVVPLMIASASASNGSATLGATTYIASQSVGAQVQASTQSSLAGVQSSPLGRSILLNIPAYSFNPVYEQAYLSSPIKKIIYTDVYQYQLINQIGAGQTYNSLITNGIANIKSVLCLPYYSSSANGGVLPIQCPLDPAGAGPTSPLCLQTQFNIQVSGQNAIYNTERYSYEQFMNQLYGVNAVNGGMTDGCASGLVNLEDFETSYCYYYVDCGRCLPVEESVPKSVNILGTNQSAKAIDMFIFVEYGVEISIDVLSGARV